MTTISEKLDRLREFTSADMLDVICVRMAFNEGPDASAFARAGVQRLDEIRELIGAGEEEWTMDALRRRCATPAKPLDDEEVARLKSIAAWIQATYGTYDYPCPDCGFNSEDASRLAYFAALALRLLPEEDR